MASNAPVIGVVADDFTGATDVASMLVREGMRTVQVIDVPSERSAVPGADAIVVALKSRTCPVADAVDQSLRAMRWLRSAGARQIYFKVCSTFDSTPAGNIGPVAEALRAALGAGISIVCPAFPENGRTVFRGHLFVGDQLLSDSGMRDHPLTPMTDSNLVRLLQAQTRERVGLLRHDTIARGASAIRAVLGVMASEGVAFAIADAISEDDLRTLGEACVDDALLVAGSGVALGLPPAHAQRSGWKPDAAAASLPGVGGGAAVLSGSCSLATNAQVRHWREAGRPAFQLDPRALASGETRVDEALDFARRHRGAQAALIHATAPPAEVRAVQVELGAARAGELVERALARIARTLVDEAGVRRLVVAGGETSGAVVRALRVGALRIGATIDPGVPWTQALDRPLQLALKSGNFGGVDFFSRALEASA